jgi:phosphate transport system protein
MPRQTFDKELQFLLNDLLAMSDMVDQAIARSIQALAERDVALAQKIIDDDEIINQAERDIDEKCLILLATQQPMAVDLRMILSVYTVASELERMADHAEGIAKITLRIGNEPLLKPLIDIPRMADKARYLLREQLQAFINHDAQRSRDLSLEDEVVDDLYNQVFRELLVFMMSDPNTIRRATYLLWAAHNLERIADRTTNIGERVLFLVTGRVEELNPTKSARS